MAKKIEIAKEGFNEILLYTTPNGGVKVEIYLQHDTIWLTQQKIADLFGVQRPSVTKHLKNIFESGELKEEVVCSILEHTTQHGALMGKTQETITRYYNLDAIISVGYRVNSSQATAFRIWATERLKEYIIKGFTMSADYRKDADITERFFATVQNKLHWAITGQTAAEIIAARVDSGKTNMGLTTWKNAPAGKIRKTDIGIAKNYLDEKELDGLNRIVTMYLDYAESQAQKGAVMYMKDWATKLDAFLQFNERAILKDAGKVSHEVALVLAEKEFEKYRVVQDKLYESDFDKGLKIGKLKG